MGLLRTGFAVLLLLAATGPATAQVHTPERGSEERAAIMDALREPVQQDLNQPSRIIFVVRDDGLFKSDGEWAFLFAEPVREDRQPVDFSRTRYAGILEEVRELGADNRLVALLHRCGGEWRTVTYTIFVTDTLWSDWHVVYGAPPRILHGYPDLIQTEPVAERFRRDPCTTTLPPER